MSALERRYRRLLALLPWEHRRRYEDEMLGVLRWYNDLMPTRIYVWDSHKKRQCIISVAAIGRLINTPDLVELTYFDERKLVFCIPADEVFAAAAEAA